MRDYAAAPQRASRLCLIGLMVLGPSLSGAQQGMLRGVVVDSLGAPIRDADVGIIALRRLTRTDDQGRFALAKLPAGRTEVSVRRLSYQPRLIHLMVTDGSDSVVVTMVAHAAVLSTIDVSASQKRRREGIEEFHRRRIRGTGVYITRDEILARGSMQTSDVLRNQPGIRFVRTRGVQGVRFTSSSIARRECMPMIWLDGQKAPGFEVDDVPASDIEGIELYNGPATTPMQFSQGSGYSTCGTIVIWSRNPGL
jgi:hypothetical protein